MNEELTGTHRGIMEITTKNERGINISKEYGFTVQEENNSVLAFDLIDHPELGTTLLFGNQIFALKYWDDDDLAKGMTVIKEAVTREYKRRKDFDATI